MWHKEVTQSLDVITPRFSTQLTVKVHLGADWSNFTRRACALPSCSNDVTERLSDWLSASKWTLRTLADGLEESADVGHRPIFKLNAEPTTCLEQRTLEIFRLQKIFSKT